MHKLLFYVISTHAPAQGATRNSGPPGRTSTDFNPRSRTGSDGTPGVTPVRRIDFNPRSRTGSDVGVRACESRRRIFQPTLPHRERLRFSFSCTHLSNFNPRSRTGSDHLAGSAGGGRPVFQPTLPHRERRSGVLELQQCAVISTHAPAQGATDIVKGIFSADAISTHAPAQGATVRGGGHPVLCGGFQPTLPHRERPYAVAGSVGDGYFNPRSRTGSDEVTRNISTERKYFNPRSRTGSDSKRIQKAPFHFVQNRKESFG